MRYLGLFSGSFVFKRNIVLQSNTVIKGAGSDETILIFDMDSNEHSFNISGSLVNDTAYVSSTAFKNDS